MRPTPDIEQAMKLHADTVWRVCTLYFPQEHDRNDAFQEAFLRYSLADSMTFNDEEHRKAWLIRVTRNLCLDMLKAASNKHVPTQVDDWMVNAAGASSDPDEQPESVVREVLEAMYELDDPPRTPVYLALYEGYTASEIADMLDAPVNTVYSWVARGRKQLKEALL